MVTHGDVSWELSHQQFVQIQSPETQSTISTMAEISASDSSWATRWPQQSAWTNDRWIGDEPAPDTSINIIPLSYPLVNCPITMEDPPFFMGKSTISMAILWSSHWKHQGCPVAPSILHGFTTTLRQRGRIRQQCQQGMDALHGGVRKWGEKWWKTLPKIKTRWWSFAY